MGLPPAASLKAKWVAPPLPASGSFDGQTILVTGGTGGLGIASAHFRNLGAAEVIITARKAPGPWAEKARRKILVQRKGAAAGEVSVVELDMNSYASCVRLVEEPEAEGSRKGRRAGCGCVERRGDQIGVRQETRGPVGFVVLVLCAIPSLRLIRCREETIQANTLSTSLLVLLLLPWMKGKRSLRTSPAHIVYITSITHMEPDLGRWSSHIEKDGGVITHYAKWDDHDGYKMYPASKLMTQYALEGLSDLASKDSKEYVPLPPHFPPSPERPFREDTTSTTRLGLPRRTGTHQARRDHQFCVSRNGQDRPHKEAGD